MALKKYRRQVIRVRDANDELPEVILSTGDEAGRIIQLVITGGENYGTHCRFWLQKEEGLNVYQDMEQVTASYPTWEAAINTGGLEPGVYPCMFRIGDNDGSVTETFKTTARVLQGMLIDAEESEEMQSQLSEFEQRTEDAIAANETATAAANDAAEAATTATEAIEHALDEVDVRVLTTGVLSVTNVDGVPTSYDVKQQVSDAINPKIEDADAATQAANGAASAANSAATNANSAATAATSATSAATQATTAANSAASSATSAASDASAAATSANNAAASATSAATEATEAAQYIEDFEDDIFDITGCKKIEITESNKYIDLSGTSVTMVDGRPAATGTSQTYSYTLVECNAGDNFTINGTGGGQTRLWGFVDSNGLILDKAAASVSGVNLIITAPKNSAWLIIHDNSGKDSFIGTTVPAVFSNVEKLHDTPFEDVVPDSIAGIKGVSILVNYNEYKLYRLWNIRHNSSWHFQVDLQGYDGTSWNTIDSIEINSSSAPSPIPNVEYFVGKYKRFAVMVIWELMAQSIILTSQEKLILKRSCVSYVANNISRDVSKLQSDVLLNPFELSDSIPRGNIVTVKQDGTGDYTSIGAAYAAITDSSYGNQYEIVVYPGTYNENNLVPPIYTHTHGLYPMSTIIDSTGLDTQYSVFDQKSAPSKLSNMIIYSHTKYCVHQDVDLYGDVLVNENLYCQKFAGGNSDDVIGLGADFGGAKFIWKNCTFVDGFVACHTNPNDEPGGNQHLIYDNCKFINAKITLTVAGNTEGEYLCEVNGCVFNPTSDTVRLRFGAPIEGMQKPNYPWVLCGSNNIGLDVFFDNQNDSRFTDYWDCVNVDNKVYVTAAESITKGQSVDSSGHIASGATVYGIALSNASIGDLLPVWKNSFDSQVVSELQNIRTGADGTVYQSAGDAVRAQINALWEAINAL